MTWNDFKKKIDNYLSTKEKEELDIFYIDTGNYPDLDRIDIHVNKRDGIIIS